MPNHILSLGLPQEALSCLSSNVCAQVHVAGDLSELNKMVDNLEVCCIVLSAKRCPEIVEDVTQLLGHTPLTTKIVLVCDEAVDVDLGKLASMGIKTLVAPYTTDDLVDKLVH